MPPVFETVMQFGGDIQLTWSTVAGQSYRLQSVADLRSTNWTDLSDELEATNSRMTFSEPINLGTNRFYRVKLLP